MFIFPEHIFKYIDNTVGHLASVVWHLVHTIPTRVGGKEAEGV